MRADVTVHRHPTIETLHGLEEALIVAVVDRVHEVSELGVGGHDGDDFWIGDDLLVKGGAVEGDDAGDHREEHEVLVGEQLGAVEGRYAVDQQLSGLLDLATDQEVQGLVHLKAVSAIPVTSSVVKGLGLGYLRL